MAISNIKKTLVTQSPHDDIESLIRLKAVKYSQALIKKRSVTPEDAGCQRWLARKLQKMGFSIELYKIQGVSNLIGSLGHSPTRFAFAGHTDVVPAPQPELWQVSPFDGEIVGDELIGRGSVDMKSALAVMIAAMEDVLASGYQPKTCWQFLVTSDEEGEAKYGTKTIVERLIHSDSVPDYCVVGEPTSDRVTGDVIKIGRRGSVSATLEVRGRQGHVAYAGNARNAVHLASIIVYYLEQISWDEGSDDFPGTGLQVTYINSGEFTDNIIPGRCEICFNIRYSHRYSLADIQAKVTERLKELPLAEDILLTLDIKWDRHCEPYFTQDNKQDSLITKAEAVIHAVTGSFPRLSTSGGSSDGRFLASETTQVFELGLPNKTIHQVNERSKLRDIYNLYLIYCELLRKF